MPGQPFIIEILPGDCKIAKIFSWETHLDFLKKGLAGNRLRPPLVATLLIVVSTGCLKKHDVTGDLSDVQAMQNIAREVSQRSAEPRIKDTMMGAILYLDDMQIRPRSGPRSSRYDACSEGSCIPFMYLNMSFLDTYFPLPNPFTGIKNEVGEWMSTVHFLPKKIGDPDGESVVTLQDSNLFVTAAITYPMFLFSEEKLGNNQIFRTMRQLAAKNMKKFKRNRSYNFWIEMDGVTGSSKRTGPYNIPMGFIEKLAQSYVDPDKADFWKKFGQGLDVPSRDWIVKIQDRQMNPSGVDAVFNIPNDADDTAIAVAMQKLNSRDLPEVKVDLTALKELLNHRDIKRSMEDSRDGWKGKDSGAFLTWLRDENLQTFSQPENGVIPLAANNVDCVVNANAIFSIALNGLQSFPGYEEASQLMLRAVEQGEWKRKCGLYYPQRMSFPYSVTRAYRDGGAQSPTMVTAMELLLKDLLDDQRNDGSFSGGHDATLDLSTALGVVSLLNIGRSSADKLSLGGRYDRAIRNGIAFLLERRQRHALYNQETLEHYARPPQSLADETYETVRSRFGYSWKSGLFFSASFWDLAQWRSEAYTVSIVLEALAKYLMAYDLGLVSIAEGRRIVIDRYAGSADEAARDFTFTVR